MGRFRQGHQINQLKKLSLPPRPHLEGSRRCPGNNGTCGRQISATRVLCFRCWTAELAKAATSALPDEAAA
jgi:hypothetical protein